MAGNRGKQHSAGKLDRNWRGKYWRAFDVYNEPEELAKRAMILVGQHQRFAEVAAFSPNAISRFGDYAPKRTSGEPRDEVLVWGEVVELLRDAGWCCDAGPDPGPDSNVVVRTVVEGPARVITFTEPNPYGLHSLQSALRYDEPGVKPFHIAATVLEVLPPGADAHYARAVLEVLPKPPRACAVHPNATLKGRAAQWVREQRELVDVVFGNTLDSHIDADAA